MMRRRTYNSSGSGSFDDYSNVEASIPLQRNELRPAKSNDGSSGITGNIISFLLAMALSVSIYYFHLLPNHKAMMTERHLGTKREITGYQKEIDNLNRRLADAKANVEKNDAELRKAKSELMNLNRRRGDEERKNKDEKARVDFQLQKVSSDNELLANTNTNLRNELQKVSRWNAEKKFGTEEQTVEVELEYPEGTPLKITPETNRKFLIKMAPVYLMPYSVNFFLEQVQRQLLDGTSFHLFADHVIVAGPKPYFNTPEVKKDNLKKDLETNGLYSMAIQEYSDQFPHYQYTVGFAGRSDGSNWYVSMEDNSKNHGPKEEKGVRIPGDPCFGKVIAGFDAIDLVHELRTVAGTDDSVRVGIKRVRIL